MTEAEGVRLLQAGRATPDLEAEAAIRGILAAADGLAARALIGQLGASDALSVLEHDLLTDINNATAYSSRRSSMSCQPTPGGVASSRPCNVSASHGVRPSGFSSRSVRAVN